MEGRLWLGPLIYKPGPRLEARTLTTTPRPMLGGPGRALSPQWAQTPSPQCVEAATWEWGSGSVPIHPLLWVPGHGCSELWLGLRRTRAAGPLRRTGYFSCASFPMAAVSPVLDCGYCLIGGMKITRFLCKNVGFSVGKFCIMPKKSWPPLSFRVSDRRLLPGARTNPAKETPHRHPLGTCRSAPVMGNTREKERRTLSPPDAMIHTRIQKYGVRC